MKSIDPSTYFGSRFWERTILTQWKVGYRGNKFLLSRCDNGHESWVKLAHLNGGHGGTCKACHCKRIATRHGQSSPGRKTSAYKKWINMRGRVASDPSYIKRGIKVCERWNLFENFLADMGEPPDPRMQLDREDGTKDYTPSNCRWLTRLQNNRNRNNLRIIEFGGMKMCVADWEKYLNLKPETLRKKLRFNRPLLVVMEECGFRTRTLPFIPSV